MNDSTSSKNEAVLKRKRHNSESYLQNVGMLNKRMRLEHSPVELPNILSRSKLHSISQPLPLEGAEYQSFSNLRNTRVRAESDSYQLNTNSENNETFQYLMNSNNGSLERRPLSELQVLSPDSNSTHHSDDRSETDVSSPTLSDPTPLLSDNELSPDCINSSEPKKNVENDPPAYVPTPRSSTFENYGSNMFISWSRFRDMAINHKPIPLNERPCPLPEIPWGKRAAYWQMLCDRDAATLTYRNPDFPEYQEFIMPRMRAILLDWLIEVSSVYKLHRETYYLAMDYLDRYLSNSDSIPKQKLQLIGITCLFMAAKMEEIYPPKLAEFAYVTDGACTDSDLLDMEKILLMNLHFRLTPISINYWVELMLQFICVDDSAAEDSLTLPQFPQNLFNQVSHLLDLASLDSNSLRYSYSELAASALTIVLNKKIALTISGLSEGNVSNCVEWMSVYWSVILEEYQYEEIDFEGDSEQVDGTHVKQQHLVSMDMYDLAQSRFELIQQSRINKGPVTPTNLLTPPWSGKKKPVHSDDCKPSCSYK
ncbi:G1/S-specific cyclin-E1 [Daktulosphaira vitifoliae]|uniref:G1/S-specific cyclin-E1 n=1 Tax=Daktulosphaira vitifoliae TaxID=58002 RepID=UPI0021A9CC3E|nr:G1/S-specific cyclin-E1 [Daktulosphaira vitifoliae]XP_050540258.1 G1/S-specific cyclin-E1 [Daktulosphaira vitifoliae]XP_050540259.1 G1/S-specific cyclin-E1 [Daktulosphaira vitifoliae]XP_050540260.1 G1/S-specific cyclin-E1 [Daktulosphaira vitifoliae]